MASYALDTARFYSLPSVWLPNAHVSLFLPLSLSLVSRSSLSTDFGSYQLFLLCLRVSPTIVLSSTIFYYAQRTCSLSRDVKTPTLSTFSPYHQHHKFTLELRGNGFLKLLPVSKKIYSWLKSIHVIIISNLPNSRIARNLRLYTLFKISGQ